MGCEDIKTSINTKAYTIEQLIVNCEQESIRYKKEWNEKQELIQEVKEKKEKIEASCKSRYGDRYWKAFGRICGKCM